LENNARRLWRESSLSLSLWRVRIKPKSAAAAAKKKQARRSVAAVSAGGAVRGASLKCNIGCIIYEGGERCAADHLFPESSLGTQSTQPWLQRGQSHYWSALISARECHFRCINSS
jgi:hypothetical protein